MKPRHFRLIGTLSAFAAAGALLPPMATPALAAGVAADQDLEVLTRGPVHEAFAESVSFEPEPGLIVRAAPPEPIEELPPEQQLEGDNVTWIPGYWAWDDERNDFLWISGIWRNLPPDRQWVPGYWDALEGGEYQWTSGYWADTDTTEVTYLPTPPPRSIDAGPNIAAPSVDHVWIPGIWVWNETRYLWRPGYWNPLRPNWTWVPSRYCWTRRGYVYVDGYWDYAVPRRGVVFAPVFFHRHLYATPGYFYTPAIVVGLNVFSSHLFVRPGCGHYYFGDYYAPRYMASGFHASFAWHSGLRGYDPIYAYDRWQHRADPGWERRRRDEFTYFRDHEADRPAHTWAAMRERRSERRDLAFATPLDGFAKGPESGLRFRTLDKAKRQEIVARRQEMRRFSQERRKMESAQTVAGTDGKKAPTRATIARSPVVGRQAERFAKDDAPPKRPEARGTKPFFQRGGKNGAPETSDDRQPERPGDMTRPPRGPKQKTEPAPESAPTPGERTKPEPKDRTKPEPKERTKPEPKERTQPEPKERTQPEPKERTKPEPKERTKPEPKERTQPEPKERTRPEPKERTGPAPSEPRTQPERKTMPQRKIEPPVREVPKREPKSPSDRQIQPRREIQPQREVQPQRQIQPRREIQPQREVQPQRQIQPRREIQPQREVQPQRQIQLRREIQPQRQIQPRRELEPQAPRERPQRGFRKEE